MFQKSQEANTATASETFPAILTDAGKVSKVARGRDDDGRLKKR